jgi:SagB-type dehydrogenase family enzyme
MTNGLHLRRAEGLVLHLAGADATVERPGAAPLYLPGEGEQLRCLWDLLDAPQPRHILCAALGEPADHDLLRRLIDARVLCPWPLTTRLARLHRATVKPATQCPVMPGIEDARLLREYAGDAACDLPPPLLTADLATALRERRTERRLSGASLSLAQLSTLLAFGAGSPGGAALPSIMGGPPGSRTYPSGGALYPIELLVCPICVGGLGGATYRYQVLAHRLVAATTEPSPRAGIERLLAHNRVIGTSVVFQLWIDFTRPSLGKYGEKAYRLALLEAGHLAQNLLLVATALGLAGVPLCGFEDELTTLQAGLAFPEQPVVYAIAVGARGSPSCSSGERP